MGALRTVAAAEGALHGAAALLAGSLRGQPRVVLGASTRAAVGSLVGQLDTERAAVAALLQENCDLRILVADLAAELKRLQSAG